MYNFTKPSQIVGLQSYTQNSTVRALQQLYTSFFQNLKIIPFLTSLTTSDAHYQQPLYLLNSRIRLSIVLLASFYLSGCSYSYRHLQSTCMTFAIIRPFSLKPCGDYLSTITTRQYTDTRYKGNTGVKPHLQTFLLSIYVPFI